MNSKTKTVLLCVLLAALLLGASAVYRQLGDRTPPTTPNVAVTPSTGADGAQPGGVPAAQPDPVAMPDITLYDADGNAMLLSAVRDGKPAVVNFWATWCSYCVAEMPDFETAYGTYGEEIAFVMLNATDGVRETVAIAQDYIAEQGFTFPVYYDSESLDASYQIGVTGYPASIFVDADGNVTRVYPGLMRAEALTAELDALLVA